MPPSSAIANAPHSAMPPARPQATSASDSVPVSRATPEGEMKMPTPMIAPMTMQVASNRPRTRSGDASGLIGAFGAAADTRSAYIQASRLETEPMYTGDAMGTVNRLAM